MDQSYARKYRALYERHWWWRAREELVLTCLRSYPPERPHGAILDIGCGDGLLFDKLEAWGPVEGIEPDATLLDPDSVWKSRIHRRGFDATFEPGGQYARVLMLDVLEHLQDPAAAVQHVARLLEPGGVFYCTVPAFRALWTNHDVLNCHVTRFTKAELLALLSDTGMEVVASRYFFHWLALPKLLVRAMERLHKRAPKPPSVPWAPINMICYGVSRAEEAMLGRLAVPFGSSVLMIARKTRV